MAIREFQVKINDVDTTIKFEDSISFGDLRKTLKTALNFKNIARGEIAIDPDEFARGITMVAIREPVHLRSLTEFDKLPWEVGMEIVEKINAVYPLKDFLMRLMKAATGMSPEQMQVELDKQQTTS